MKNKISVKKKQNQQPSKKEKNPSKNKTISELKIHFFQFSFDNFHFEEHQLKNIQKYSKKYFQGIKIISREKSFKIIRKIKI